MKSLSQTLILSLNLFLISSPTWAHNCSDSNDRSEYKTCLAEVKADQQAIMEQELKSLELRILKDFSGEEKAIVAERLSNAQTQWKNYQEAQCSLRSVSMFNGSGEEGQYMICAIELLRKRTVELKDLHL